MQARVKWIEEERMSGSATSGHAVVLDAGEVKQGSSPLEIVLVGLCACTASDVITILNKKRQRYTSFEVCAVVTKRAAEPPRVFEAIELTYKITGAVTRKAAEDAVRLSQEKYCSVSAMLAKTAFISTSIVLAEQ